jgi:Cdc6-like AAA superfamily ATPase
MTLNASNTDIDWGQLEQDIGRLFSAAPLTPYGTRAYELYPGRASEVRQMMRAVRDPAKQILLYGERGLGKTSLCNTFWQNSSTAKDPILTARVQVYPYDDFSSLWLRVLVEFKTAGARVSSDFGQVTPDLVRREFQKIRRDQLSIIIVDEFDLLQDKPARELTVNLLKSLHDNRINVTVILIGVAENVEELINNHRSLRRVLSLVKLERMNIIELNEILESRLRLTPLTISDEARSEIVTLACGLPYYVQTLARFTAESAIKHHRIGITTEDVNAAIEDFLVESGPSFADDYWRATNVQCTGKVYEKIILASALAPAEADGTFQASEVATTLNLVTASDSYEYSRTQQYLAQLISEKRGKLLTRTGGKGAYRYRFSDALIQPFVIMRAIRNFTIDDRLRHRLFRFEREQFRDTGHRLGLAEANAVQLGMIVPTAARVG